ncbi:uncharacterized protein LOC112593256 [Melanaphis sacchari]|uniref:uncharacterized protein LOC112593256 n=1 Tax=Melanaphis sacchari TaxID=742174 RepID=UPI000DC12D55|nr:uncharacterized protein LOC112593256 [Melanaphis sacchari]
MEISSTELKCSSCETIVNDYSPEFIEQMKTNYGDYKDFQEFLKNFKKDPDLVRDQCVRCRSLKWQNMKYKNHNQMRSHAQTAGASRNILTKFQIILVTVFLVLGILLPNFLNTNISNTNGLSEDKLKSTLLLLKSQFPSLQRSILNKLSGAFSRLQKPGEPIVFMLLHDDTNKKTTDCLASYASFSAKKYLFTNSQKSLWMNGSEWNSYSDFNHQDLLYEKLNKPLEENNVLVVENLQDLPWPLAQTLHPLCDTINPKIAKAMYLLELRVKDDLKQLSEGDKIKVAERAMNMVWEDAPNEFRAPLIARLTSYVDAVLWESDQPCHRESFIKISP